MSDAAMLYGLVLAGGKSRRMGSDKALLSSNGETQLSRAVHLLERFADRVFVSVRPDQAGEPERRRFASITDRYTDIGPIAGVLSAMDEAPDAAWLVVACDLPNIDDTTLATLLDQRDAERPFTAFRSSHDGLPEPLCAIYEPHARNIIDAFVTEGIVCPRKMLIRSDTTLLDQPHPAALDNINTPEDLERSTLQAST